MRSLVLVLLMLLAPSALLARDADTRMRELADRYVALELARDPLQAYAYGLPIARHDGLEDVGARAGRRHARRLETLRRDLSKLDVAEFADPAARAAYFQLREALEARAGLEVCALPRWSPLNHMNGWHLALADAAAQQPVATDAHRRQALARWRAVPDYVAAITANLRRGLETGYAVPRGVVSRVIAQMDGLLAPDSIPETWLAPAVRARDGTFEAAFTHVVEQDVLPALRVYRDFLRDEYLPRASAERSLGRLPRGRECYRALLRLHTTLAIDPAELFAAGNDEIARNEAELSTLAREAFGGVGLAALSNLPASAEDNRFASEEDAIGFARAVVERARQLSVPLFPRLPDTECIVEPSPPHEQGSGRSSHYESPTGERRHGIYRLNTETWRTDLRSTAEVTAVHESWPGHHLQLTWLGMHPWPASTLTEASAFVEGWGRYAESLAEEAGIYRNPYTPIAIRVWPARGLVTDIGLHWQGWSEDDAKRFLLATGRYTDATAESALDRAAALPGQWTAYDAGAMEIRRLRREAEAGLGERFSLPEFHGALLSQGALPLTALRHEMRQWIERRRGAASDPEPR